MTDDLVLHLRRGEVSIKMPDGSVQLVNHVAADRIEALEEIMQKLAEPFKKAAPLFGAQNLRSVRVGDQVIEELLAALGEKKDV